MATQRIAFTNPKHASHAFATFSEMREMEVMCDIKLETSVDELPAHRIVLAACSPYFRDALKDFDVDEETFVLPEEYDSNVIAAIVNYFYTGRLEIEATLLPDMITTAVFLQAKDIVDRCEDHVIPQLDIVNCLDYYSLAEKYDLTDLQKTIIRFINCHFTEISELDVFLKLPAKLICSVVSSDVLNVEKEEDVYEALWKWCKHDEENRKCHREDVLGKVRFFQLHPQFLTERVIPECCTPKGEEICKDAIKQAIIYQSSEKKQRLELQEKLNPRYPSKAIFMFDSRTPIIEMYDPITEDCVEGIGMMVCRDCAPDQGWRRAAVVVGNDLFVVTTSKVEKFDSLLLTWEKVAEGVDVREAAICADEDSFYVLGGRDQGLAVKCFKVESLCWSKPPLDNMTTGRRLAAAVASNGRLYVLGGLGVEEPLASVHRYSHRRRGNRPWKELVPLNTPRYCFSALIVRNKIYAIGGRNNEHTPSNTIETFDLSSQEEKWVQVGDADCQSIPNMIRCRSEFGAAFFGGKLWCLGGRGENSVERFDFGTKSWELVAGVKLGEVRYAMSCVMYPLLDPQLLKTRRK